MLNCLITDANIRIFGNAIAALARIGHDITFDVSTTSLAVRALNDAKSSYAAATFQKEFFADYQGLQYGDNFPSTNTQRESWSCIISSKALANALRGLRGSISLQMYFAPQGANNFFVLVFKLKNGVTRTHCVTYADHEAVRAVFDRTSAKHIIVGTPKLWTNFIEKIHGTDEVSLLASHALIQLQGFHEDGIETTVRGAVHTSIAMEVNAFERILLTLENNTNNENNTTMDGTTGLHGNSTGSAIDTLISPINITFSLRELKHIVNFAQQPVVDCLEFAVFFNEPSAPIMFSTVYNTASTRSYMLDLVVATMEQPVLPLPGSPIHLLANKHSTTLVQHHHHNNTIDEQNQGQ